MQQQMQQLNTLQRENVHLRTGRPSGPKTKRPDRPTVNVNIDEREWELFKDTWQRYKTMTGLAGEDGIRMELRASCSSDVNKLLFEFVGATMLDTASEQELLGHIRSIAVKGTHKEVHRMNFGKLIQQEGESITQFVARLKSQVTLCQFTIVCPSHNPPTSISYAEEMVTQQLIAGLRNQDHQSRVLAESSMLITLREKVDRLQCLEATAESTSQMRMVPAPPLAGITTASIARQSQYRHNKKNFQQLHTKPPPRKCRGCGRSSHPGKSMARKDCPAFNKACGSCGIMGHFRAVCEKNKSGERSRSNAAEEEEETQYDELEPPSQEASSFSFATQDDPEKASTTTTTQNSQPHMEWNSNSFMPQRPASTPKINVHVTVLHSAHEHFGMRWKDHHRATYSIEAIADSGCQTCTAGTRLCHIKKAGVRLSHASVHKLINLGV